MVPIAKFNNRHADGTVMPEFSTDHFTSIIDNEKCKDLEYLVLSIVGPRGTGKSFLMNLMICFLNFLIEV